jgi:hypothetical protein
VATGVVLVSRCHGHRITATPFHRVSQFWSSAGR